LNEEGILARCLESVSWSDDIVVFDSYSTDRTVEIAKEYGARVIQRRFDNEREHREASLRIRFKYEWVFNPDADEITTPELRDELLQLMAEPQRAEVAYGVRRKELFLGRWIRHSSLYPTWFPRLFRPQQIHFERLINLTYVANGPEGRLQNHLLHYSFNKGFDAWFEKHNRYSSAEALEYRKSLAERSWHWTGVFNLDPVLRRRALKEWAMRMPLRPTLRFLYMYLFRRGFLDGRAGFTYCRLLSIYEYLIYLKMQEIAIREGGESL